MKKILLTGYSGFIGHHLLNNIKDSYNVSLLGRKPPKNVNFDFLKLNLDELSEFNHTIIEANTVIHCAGISSLMNDKDNEPLDEFRKVNTYGTLKLAQEAAASNVKRFIFISSIKVNGEVSEFGKPFKPDDNYIPIDPYGLSKYEAEIGLRKIAKETGMEVVIIRPPLIYGPGVKANFSSMLKWVNKGFPLPLGGIKHNRRSLVSVENLVDLIVTCVDHPKAANQTFLVSDDDDVSTTQLLDNMALALDVPNRLLPIPSNWFILAAKLIGKPAISQRLCGSLQVDISKTKEILNWKPPFNSSECMNKTANAFLESLGSNKRSN